MRANPLGGGFQVSSNLNPGRDICRNNNFTAVYSGKCLQSQLPRRPWQNHQVPSQGLVSKLKKDRGGSSGSRALF